MADKRKLILDAMQQIMTDNKSTNATISDVAKKAGIAKGSVYYYFNSKDEIIDAVIERAYADVVKESSDMLSNTEMTAIDKLRTIFDISVYPLSNNKQSRLLKLLNVQDNVIIHQKFCVIVMRTLTPILTEVIKQGINDGICECDYPRQYAEFILSMIVLSLDSVLLPVSEGERIEKLKALSQLLELGLKLEKGSFAYIYKRVEKENIG